MCLRWTTFVLGEFLFLSYHWTGLSLTFDQGRRRGFRNIIQILHTIRVLYSDILRIQFDNMRNLHGRDYSRCEKMSFKLSGL